MAEPAALTEWRAARAAAVAAVQAYTEALHAARAADEVHGFGFSKVDKEFQEMTEASNRAHRLVAPLLDALAVSAPPAVKESFTVAPEGAVAFVWHEKNGVRKAVLAKEGSDLPHDTLLYAHPARKPLSLSEFREWFARRLTACGPAGVTDQTDLAEEVMRWTETRHGITFTEEAAHG